MERLVSVLPDRSKDLDALMNSAEEGLSAIGKRVKRGSLTKRSSMKRKSRSATAFFALRGKLEILFRKIDSETDAELRDLTETSD
jgi:hypothetical protein